MPDRNTRAATGQRRSTASSGSERSSAAAAVGSGVLAGVRSDINDLPDNLRHGALAATAIRLAEALDDPVTSATARSMCARALVEIMGTLRDLCPPAQEADDLDDLAARRTARRARSAGA